MLVIGKLLIEVLNCGSVKFGKDKTEKMEDPIVWLPSLGKLKKRGRFALWSYSLFLFSCPQITSRHGTKLDGLYLCRK